MKTKIVYVVASLDDDIYMEQAIVSAWSARHYNVDCKIEMVCDQDTFATLNSGIRAQYKSLFDQIHVREFQPEQSMMERSRWMKTTLREIVEGDYLYLDTDTVVCADLSYVDDFDFDIGMVLDQNCDFDDFLYRDVVINRVQQLFDVDISNEIKYFNSGVAYVKEKCTTSDFYKTWHKLWQSKKNEIDGLKDQASLAVANIKHNHSLTEMSGDLNCQVMVSIQYLYTAKVMHYFNTLSIAPHGLNPFYGTYLFEYVKNNGITDDIKHKILNNKSLFSSPSMPVPYEGAMLWRKHLGKPTPSEVFEKSIKSSNSYYLLCSLWYRIPKFMKLIDSILGVMKRTSDIVKNVSVFHSAAGKFD